MKSRIRCLCLAIPLFAALPASAAPPANDDVATPHVIDSLPFVAAGADFREATWSEDEPVPCHDSYAQLLGRPVPSRDPGPLWSVVRQEPGTLWYRLDPTQDTIVSPSLYRHHGTEVIGLGVYEVTPGGLRLIACAWPELNDDWTRPIPILLRAGSSYLIAADLRGTPTEAFGSVYVVDKQPWDLSLANLQVEPSSTLGSEPLAEGHFEVSFDVDTGPLGPNEHVEWSISACSAEGDPGKRCVELGRGVNLGGNDFSVREQVSVTGLGDFSIRASIWPRSTLDLSPEDNVAESAVSVLVSGVGSVGPVCGPSQLLSDCL